MIQEFSKVQVMPLLYLFSSICGQKGQPVNDLVDRYQLARQDKTSDKCIR